ncbi:hypothetical protein FACS18949_18240 [Clostridia bacterium]|nr:hypothetical protein FACS18949_18240 [Clostridia bacterium]
MRRGRNADAGNIPKAATRGEYAGATALEAVFAHLWLSGETERARELFEEIFKGEV